jgi:quinol monooxygenase YgiN
VFYELYRDRQAFEAHERQEHVRRFLKGREQYLAATRVDTSALFSVNPELRALARRVGVLP